MSDEILPCPFCGSDAKAMRLDFGGGTVWGVFCDEDFEDEYSHGHFIDNYKTKEEAVAAWNTRMGMEADR